MQVLNRELLLERDMQRQVFTVWRSVADNEVCVAALEVRDDLLRDGMAGDVALQLRYALDGRHRLQVYRQYLRQVRGPARHVLL